MSSTAQLLAEVRRKRREVESKSGFKKVRRLLPGKTTLRVLPSWNPDNPMQIDQSWGQHFIKSGKDLKAIHICTRNTFGESCPICDQMANISATSTDPQVLDMVKEAKPSNRTLVNAFIINSPDGNNSTEAEILELPPSVFAAILSRFESGLEEGINIMDPDDGNNLIIEKSGTGLDTKYDVTTSMKSSPLPEGVADNVANLENWAHQEHDAQLQKALSEMKAISGVKTNVGLPAPGGNKPAAIDGSTTKSVNLSEGNTEAMASVEPAPFDNDEATTEAAKATEEASDTEEDQAEDDSEAAAIEAELEELLNG